jgi:hypothetical protein
MQGNLLISTQGAVLFLDASKDNLLRIPEKLDMAGTGLERYAVREGKLPADDSKSQTRNFQEIFPKIDNRIGRG